MKKYLSIIAILVLVSSTLVGCASSKSKLPLLEGNYYYSDTEYITFSKNKSVYVHSANMNNTAFGSYESEGEYYLLKTSNFGSMLAGGTTATVKAYPSDGNLYIEGNLLTKK